MSKLYDRTLSVLVTTVLVVSGAVFGLPFLAQAHNVYDASGQKVVSVIPDEVYNARMDAWRYWVVSERLVYPAGTSFATDDGLIVYHCPFYFFMGCVLPMPE